MNERSNLKGQQLVALFLAGCIFFNYPILSLFSVDGLIGGIPLLYVYIFTAWIALIALIAIVIEH